MPTPTPTTPQQGGNASAPQQGGSDTPARQPGQDAPAPQQQQGQQPLYRDWAAI